MRRCRRLTALMLVCVAGGPVPGRAAPPDRPGLPTLMALQAPAEPAGAGLSLPPVSFEPFRSPFPLNDRLDADSVFDRPFPDALREGLGWYLARHGADPAGRGEGLRLSAVFDHYEGWKRPGRWGAAVSLRVRLYHGTRVLLTESVRSTVRYPSEEAALAGDHPGLTSREILFTRIGLELSERVVGLLKRAAAMVPPAPGTATAAAPGAPAVVRASVKPAGEAIHPPAARAAAAVPADRPQPPTARPVERGVLTIESSADHAEVFLDGVLIGTSPLVDLVLAAGPYSLEVRKEGFHPWTRRITVLERAASRFYAEMLPEEP